MLNCLHPRCIDDVITFRRPSPFSYEVFAGWGELLKLGIPSAISLFIEWGGFEVNAAMVGRMGVEQLATHSVFAQYVKNIKS